MARLDDIASTFVGVDEELRLELLLDYARRLPMLPPEYRARRAAGENRVPECMTPVYLWMEAPGGRLRILVDVAEEAPTVRGILSILVDAYDGLDPGEAGQMPDDLLDRLRLADVIRMNRAVGMRAIMGRIKRRARELAAAGANGSDAS